MQNVGGIQYTVVADTGQLIKAEQDTVRSAKNIEGSLKKVGRSSVEVDKVSRAVDDLGKQANVSNNALSGMQKTLLGMATLGTAVSIANMADDYRTLTERVRFAVESQEEYEKVQRRLIQSSNESYRSLEEASEVFIGTSDNLRSLGFSLDEALDIADSLSFAFVKNATSIEGARNALSQYDVALNKGKVDMKGWQVINNAVPTLAQDIAKSLGVTSQEVLNMGIAGEITAKMLNDALLQSFESNKEAATGMATSIQDAFVNLRTNFQVFIGEANKTAGATDIIANAIDLVSKNLQTLATLGLAAGAGAFAKYATSLAITTAAHLKNYVAQRGAIQAELELARANLTAAQTEVARTASLVAKGAAHAKNKAAIDAETLATARLATAQAAASRASMSFLGLLGGPAGLVGMLAAGALAISSFASSTKQVKGDLEDLKPPLDSIVESFKQMTDDARSAAMVKYELSLTEAVKKQEESYSDLLGTIQDLNKERFSMLGRAFDKDGLLSASQLKGFVEELNNAKNNGEQLGEILERMATAMNLSEDEANRLKISLGFFADSSTQVDDYTKKVSALSETQRELAGTTDNATSALQRQQDAMNQGFTSGFDDITKSLIRQKNTLDDAGSAVAIYTRQYNEAMAANTSVTEDGVKVVAKLTAEQQKQHEENLRIAKAIDDERESRKSANKEIANSSQVLKDLQNELYLATLSGKELAIARAEQRLNEFATQQEVQAVRDLAAALYDLQTIGGTKEEQDEYIEGDTDRLTGGAFDDQIARYEEEAELERQRYADQLERLMQARETQLQTEDEYNQKEFELREKHNERMGRIEQAKNKTMIDSTSNAFGSIAGILQKSEGEQSNAYKAMFAMSKAFSLASTLLALPTSIAEAMKLPWPANLAAAAVAAGTVTAQIAAVKSTSFGGGRQYGGPVSANTMYRVNETGESEIFNAGGGKQYFIPNSNGEIIPAKNVNQGAGQSKVTVNLIEDASRGGEVEQFNDDQGQVINLIVANIRNGGEVSQAMEDSYGIARRGQ